MFCRECGNELVDDAVFCNKCGAKVAADSASGITATSAPRNVGTTAIKKKRKWVPFVLLFSTLIIGILTLLVIIYVRSNSPEHRLQEQLDLGYKYLSELDYDRAIAAFEAAIDIDPNSAEAYQGLIDAYAGSGDTDGILQAYEWASENLGKNDLKEIRETVTDAFVDAIDRTVAEGDYDTAMELADDLSEIDSKTADRTLQDVIEKQNSEESNGGMENVVDGESTDEGMELIDSGNYSEAFDYYSGLIEQNPSSTDPYIACAVVYLASDDSISALQILENGIRLGADAQTLLLVEDYIRDNTIPVSCAGTHIENGGVIDDAASGWSVTTFDEYGNKISFEKHLDNSEVCNVTYDMDGNELIRSNTYDGGYNIYSRSYNEYGDMIYGRYEYGSASRGDVEIIEYAMSYEYDESGKKIRCDESLPTPAVNHYEYDENGNMTHFAQVYPDGSRPYEMFYEYDSLGRVVSWHDNDPYNPEIGSNTYDERGNVISETGLWRTAENVYDLMNNVIHSSGIEDMVQFTEDYLYTYHFVGDMNSVLAYY
ncbi:MAG: zinc-ribbon domain-containing protein [Lachnospiraceae bacterium]|nr:zinc-ribbon domain-containing protein [Lachnospiraceae bacterium]